MVHSFAHEQEFAQPQHSADVSARSPAHNDRLHLCHVAFLIIGKAQVELLAAHQTEYRIAEEFEALVGSGPCVGAGRVCEGSAEKLWLAESVADRLLTFFQDFGLFSRGPFRWHN